MSNKNSSGGGMQAMFATFAIPVALLIGIVIYVFILGAKSNFDAEGHPIPGNYLGVIHEGGFIVPLLIGILMTIIIFSVERFMTIAKAKGSGRLDEFVRTVKSNMAANNLEGAIAACDKQKGSLANVIRAGIDKYQSVRGDSAMDKESKVAAVQKEIEEATALELPMLSKNLVIISTCATIATLWGLIGTVLGMIRSFAALANAGAPDTTALATGISEALINTALGILASVIGIIMYNYFSTKIDAMTYSMDEAGFSIVQSVNTAK